MHSLFVEFVKLMNPLLYEKSIDGRRWFAWLFYLPYFVPTPGGATFELLFPLSEATTISRGELFVNFSAVTGNIRWNLLRLLLVNIATLALLFQLIYTPQAFKTSTPKSSRSASCWEPNFRDYVSGPWRLTTQPLHCSTKLVFAFRIPLLPSSVRPH